MCSESAVGSVPRYAVTVSRCSSSSVPGMICANMPRHFISSTKFFFIVLLYVLEVEVSGSLFCGSCLPVFCLSMFLFLSAKALGRSPSHPTDGILLFVLWQAMFPLPVRVSLLPVRRIPSMLA